MKPNTVKRSLLAGRRPLGSMVFEFNSTGIARLAADAGAEFLIFDQEHSGWSLDTIRMLVATSRPYGVAPFVRVPTASYHLLSQALDVGAMGLMVPMVESEAQARVIADSCRYPPVGRRGAAFGVAHDDYTCGDIVEKMRTANEEVLLIAQIETAAGVENVDAIAGVSGIDVLWIGHFDLTNSLGIPGEFSHPAYLAAVERVQAACRRHGKPAGIMVSTPDEARAALAQGFRIIAYGGDLWLYREALRAGLASVRACF